MKQIFLPAALIILLLQLGLADYPCDDKSYLCGCSCKVKTTPCQGICPHRMWYCRGRCLERHESCNGTCFHIDLVKPTVVGDAVRCMDTNDVKTCGPVWVPKGDMCIAECEICRDPLVQMGNSCLIPGENVWLCDGKYRTDQYECQGKCISILTPCKVNRTFACVKSYYVCTIKITRRCFKENVPCQFICGPSYQFCPAGRTCLKKNWFYRCGSPCYESTRPCYKSCKYSPSKKECPLPKCWTDTNKNKDGALMCIDGPSPCFGKCGDNNTWFCNNYCISTTKACIDECYAPQDFVCGSDCRKKSERHLYHHCNGHCINSSTSCDRKCNTFSELSVPCGDYLCIHPNNDSWTCNEECIPATMMCDGKCRNASMFKCIISETVFCIKLKSICLGECDEGWWKCNDTCIRDWQTCNGQCNPQGPRNTTCGKNLCVHWSNDSWTCQDLCIPGWRPCLGLCRNESLHSCKETDYFRCIDKSLICKGQCQSNYWKCDGLCILNWQSCNGACDFYGTRDKICGDICIEANNDSWPCGADCIPGWQLCGGKCRNESMHICSGTDGKFCRDNGTTCQGDCRTMHWKCDGICIPNWRPCQGECNQVDEKRKKCGTDMCILLSDDSWTCKNKCISSSKPCKGLCKNKSMYICHESDKKVVCKRMDDLCLGDCPPYLWKCDYKCIPQWKSCSGKCNPHGPRPRICGADLCISWNNDSWTCKGECIPGWKPCGNQCRNTSLQSCFINGSFVCIPIDDPCPGKCPPDRWKCYNKCIPKWKSCYGKCEVDGARNTLCGEDLCIHPNNDSWTCKDQCIPGWIPCEGKCRNSSLHICKSQGAYGYICKDKANPCGLEIVCEADEWKCGSKCISKLLPCKKKCYGKESWFCNGVCQNMSHPCGQNCPTTLTLCKGVCIKGPCVVECPKDKYECENNCIDRNEPCQGRCPVHLRPCRGKCIPPEALCYEYTTVRSTSFANIPAIKIYFMFPLIFANIFL